jgi:hypothetical protein
MQYRPQYFTLKEFACPDVYNKFGDMAWQFLDDKMVITIDWIRRTLGKPITINNWHNGGEFTQRGLRCIQCSLVKDKCIKGEIYESAHILGKAVDFDVEGMSADDVRIWIALNKDKLPYNIRIERDVAWCHLDTEDTGSKITFFQG